MTAARIILCSSLLALLGSCGVDPASLGVEASLASGKADGTPPCANAGEGAMQESEGGLWLWNQPPTSATDWNGQCGNTAAANYILHACNWCLSPSDLDYAWDGLPGSRPSTVRDLINAVPACQKVKLYDGSTDDELTPRRLCAHAGPTSPVPLLINASGGKKKLHWVNVLACDCRLEPCGLWSGTVRYGTWGGQQTTSCDELRRWLDDVPWLKDANWVGR
jgi:hypothetical protein